MKKVLSFTLCVVVGVIALGVAKAADTPPEKSVIDCGQDKVVLFSRYGRYAIGWTVRVTDEDTKPVDWSLWEKDEKEHTHEFFQYYDVLDCAIDFQQKQIVILTLDHPYWPDKRRGNFGVFWSPDTNTPRYCLVQNQSYFATDNLLLVKFDKSGITQRDLVLPLGKVVRNLLREKMPLTSEKYAISYPKSDWDDGYGYMPPEFHKSSVDIPFTANLPKSSFDQVKGVITVHLPDAAVLKISSDTLRDDPFQDDPELARADHELNGIYSTLQKQLNPSAQAALKKEQLDWMWERNVNAGDYPGFGSEPDAESEYRRDRNQRLLESTRERSAELKKRLQK